MAALSDDQLKAILAKLGKAELVAWITAQAANNTELRRALLSLVAPQTDTAALVSELKQVIRKAWGRTRTSREPWKLARPIAADLEQVLAAVEQLIERGQAVAAENVLQRFVEAGDKGFDRVDDSYGYLSPLCHQAVTLWGKAWAAIEPRDPALLVQLVYDGVQDNGFAIRDYMIRDFAVALGRDGLLMLADRFTAEHQANLDGNEADDWKQHRPMHFLADVADALGDVEMYIDAKRRCGQEAVFAMPIARRLLDAGRPTEALEYLDRADTKRSHYPGEKDDYTTLRVKILQALNRDDEARDTLWQAFHLHLNGAALDRLIALTPRKQQAALTAKALTTAEAHPNKLTAATFLLQQDQIDRAAALIDSHPQAFDGRYYGSLLTLANALQEAFPAQAWVLYRSLLLSILEENRSKAYRHAADYLAIAATLAAQAGLHGKHQALLAQLQAQHGRKRSFWSLVKR